MALIKEQLQVLAHGARLTTERSTHKVFHYITADAVADVETADYFNGAADWFTEGTGDIIMAVMVATHASNYVLKQYVVKRAAGVITVKPEVDAT